MTSPSEQEARAAKYQDRWRYVGSVVATICLVLGIILSPNHLHVRWQWLTGAGLSVILSESIGRVVYRHKSPW